jgi:hypothetical protein
MVPVTRQLFSQAVKVQNFQIQLKAITILYGGILQHTAILLMILT